MANLNKLRDYVEKAYDSPHVPASSPLLGAWRGLLDATMDGSRPHHALRIYLDHARKDGHLPWRT